MKGDFNKVKNNELMKIYFETKDLLKRNNILKELIFNLPKDGEEFFLTAFKRERYIDMKLCAIRGYSAYATEENVNKYMLKLLSILKKIPVTTPYCYAEYEIMRSAYLMPYLLENYKYECFLKFNEQLELQYVSMPDVFKNIFSCNSNGEIYSIRDSNEVNRSISVFFGRN